MTECDVCGAQPTDDDLDGFHRLMWSDHDAVDAGDVLEVLNP